MPAGDIALAFRQYWGATLDTAWLRTSGWPVIHGVARYYASRAQLSPDDGLYHIANTTGPDEQNVNVVDSAFGNCIAKMTLLAAHDLAASAGAAPNSTFKHIADKMFIPYDSELDYHPEYLHWNGTKHTFCSSFILKNECLPRQTRDKHQESCQTRGAACRERCRSRYLPDEAGGRGPDAVPAPSNISVKTADTSATRVS